VCIHDLLLFFCDDVDTDYLSRLYFFFIINIKFHLDVCNKEIRSFLKKANKTVGTRSFIYARLETVNETHHIFAAIQKEPNIK